MKIMLKESLENQVFHVVENYAHRAEAIEVGCASCKVRSLCWPKELSPQELDLIEELVVVRRKVKRGGTLVRNDQQFTSLYAVRSGFFKTHVVAKNGREQVIGFQMAGDVMGLDGIEKGQHTCNAVALEDSEVCVMPFHQIEELSRKVIPLNRHIHKMMSQEITLKRRVILWLGSMRSEERIAAFLLNLIDQLHARGFSKKEIILRMTREEIGSLLSLNLETVSRTFSKFSTDGILEVNHRHLHILDMNALRDKANPAV